MFDCGEDASIGYRSHNADEVELYLEETFTFRVATPEAAIALTRSTSRTRGRPQLVDPALRFESKRVPKPESASQDNTECHFAAISRPMRDSNTPANRGFLELRYHRGMHHSRRSDADEHENGRIRHHTTRA